MADSQTKIGIIVELIDKTAGALNKIGVGVEKMSGDISKASARTSEFADKGDLSLLKLNAAIGIVQQGWSLLSSAISAPINAMVGLAGTVEGLVREYDKSIVAQVQLETMLRLQGAAVDSTSKRYREYAKLVQETTRYDAGAVVAGQALAVSMLGKKANIEAVTDAAVDLAAGLGIDLQSAFSKIIQSANTGSLRLGGMSIKLSESKDAGKRLDEVLKGVNDRFGGIASNVATLGAGPIDQLANAWHDLKASIGGLISATPEFRAFVESVKELFKRLDDYAAQNSGSIIDQFGKGFNALIGIVGTVMKAVVVLGEQIVRATDAIIDALNPIDAMFSRTAGDVREEIDELRATLKQPLNFEGDASIRPRIMSEIASLEAELAKMSESDPFAQAKKGAGELADQIGDIIAGFKDIYSGQLEAAKATQQFQQGQVFDNARDAVHGPLPPDTTEAQARSLSEAAAEQSAAAAELKTAADAGDVNNAAMAGNIDDFGLATTDFDSTVDDFDSATLSHKDSAAALMSSGSGLSDAGLALNGSSSSLNISAEELIAAAEAIANGNSDFADSVRKLDNAAGDMADAASNLTSAARYLIESAGGTPGFAEGAIVTRPTRALFGEAGPEAVIPLNASGARFFAEAMGLARGTGPGSGGITISAQNLTLSEQGLNAVLNQFDRKLGDRMTLRRKVNVGAG